MKTLSARLVGVAWRAAWWVVSGVLLLTACAIIAVPALRHADWTFSGAEGTSMVPTVSPGDLVVAHPIRPEDLKPGDLVMFQYGRAVVGHRLVSATTTGGPGASLDDAPRWRLLTQGDALENPDPPVPGEALVGKIALVVPGTGWIVSDNAPIEYGAVLLFLLWSIGAMQRLSNTRAVIPNSHITRQALQTETQL